jgi:hypothetical protein
MTRIKLSRTEWLAKRDALAALLPSRDAQVEWVFDRITEEYGPCPPEPPSVTWKNAHSTTGYRYVATINGEWISVKRNGGLSTQHQSVTDLAWTHHVPDDDTLRALLALKEGAT